MKLWVPYEAIPAASSLNISPGPGSTTTPMEGTLQQVRKNSRWKKCVLATFLLVACAYAGVVFLSGHTCPSNDYSEYSQGGGAHVKYCKLAAWSRAVLSSTSDPSKVVFPTGPGLTLALPEHSNVLPHSTSIDRIFFGIGAFASSWNKKNEYIKLWWKPGVTRGFLWVDQNLDLWQEGDAPFKISESTARFGYTHGSNERSALRIARIVVESFRLDSPNVDWFVMGDDDTLFFKENLVKVLSKYDYRKPHYIGMNSEDTRQSERHLYTLAFGGGGFAISYPLAKALSETLDECLDRYTILYGSDERVKACVSELGVPLTKEPGFHQLDVHGDITGLLSAHPVSPTVSLHHLDEVEPIFYGATQLDAAKRLMKAVRVSPPSIFQQSICYDETRQFSFSVSWGYVVQVYEGFVTPRKLEVPATTFISWAWRREFDAFTLDTRQLAAVCARPTRFFMVNAGVAPTANRSERVGISFYDRQVEFVKEGCKPKPLPMDTVRTIRVENEPIPDEWYENPRRQCCQVKAMNSRSISIRVGTCGESESLVVGNKVPTRRLLR